MLFELPKSEYNKINKLLHKDLVSVQCQTVIDTTSPGFIYADSIESPKTAIVYHQGEEGFYFVGDYNNTVFNDNILGFIQNQLKARMTKLGLDCFEFSGDSPAWDTVFRKIFKDVGLWESKQRVYLAPENYTIPRISDSLQDADIQIKEVPADLINDASIENIEFLTDEAKEFWFGWNDFTTNGGGLYAFKDTQIVGKCVADGDTGKLISVRIEVKEDFRKQGLASHLAADFMEWISKRGRSVYWECSDENQGSRKLAEKNGLQLYTVYCLFGFELG